MKSPANRPFLTSVVTLAAVLAAGALVQGLRPAAAANAPAATASSVLTVSVVTPQTETWPKIVQGSGPLSAWQEIIVSPETGGLRIAELLVDVGARVKRGDLLARLSDEGVQADLRKQQAAVARARATLAQATANLQRARRWTAAARCRHKSWTTIASARPRRVRTSSLPRPSSTASS